MVDQANSAEGASATREAATNLGREFLETVRGDAYASVTPTLLSTELQAMPGYQSGTGPVVIRRRNLDYTITANVVSIDDPKDGLAASGDNQPDDLKRITAQVSWTGRRGGRVNLASMLSSSGAKIGIKLNSFTMTSPSSTTIDTTTTATQAVFSASATGATRITFAVDGTDQPTTAVTPAGNCTGTTQPSTPSAADGPTHPPPAAPPAGTCPAPPCPKHSPWTFSPRGDGVSRTTARTVAGAGIAGPPMAINVAINKNQRTKPCGVG